MRRFLTALAVAPLAGALAGFLPVMVVSLFAGNEHERTLAGAASSAAFFGFYALVICIAYTLVVGSGAYAYARLRGRQLSLTVAIVVALVAGALPWSILMVSGRDLAGEALMFPALALLCSLATAWTFWRIALAPQAAV